MAQLDGTGVSTAVIEAMIKKLHKCFGMTEEEKNKEEELDEPEEIAEQEKKSVNPENFWNNI